MREACEQDVAFIRRLFLLPHAQAFLNAPSREMILAAMEDPNGESYILEHDGDQAGNLLIRTHGFLIDFQMLVVARQGIGAGTFAMRWGLQRAFGELGAHRAFLEVREDNGRMRRLCQKLGFNQEGVYRDGFCDERTGEFHNLCPYGLLENEYPRRCRSV